MLLVAFGWHRCISVAATSTKKKTKTTTTLAPITTTKARNSTCKCRRVDKLTLLLVICEVTNLSTCKYKTLPLLFLLFTIHV